MALIAIDFDHTIIDTDTQKPIEGAKDAISLLHEKGHKIMIHSCNNPEWIRFWMRSNNIHFDHIWGESGEKGKPICFVYIDDRGVGFRGDWNKSLEETFEILRTRKNL